MIKIEKVSIYGFEEAIRGMRNPMNSWKYIDSDYCLYKDGSDCAFCPYCNFCHTDELDLMTNYIIGKNDMELALKLAKSGTDHSKYRRFIIVYADVLAPLYWWKEYDTYKVGTVANSCSTMHKIAEKEFEKDDFSYEHLDIRTIRILENTIDVLNDYRHLYINYNADDFEIKGCPSKKDIWWQMIQLLPTSYNQKRTVLLNYEVLANMYKSRRYHKQDEWRNFCKWIETLPYSELITCSGKDADGDI